MPYCDYCEEEFDNIAALARHIKKVHSPATVKKKEEGDTKPCPVCEFKLKWTTATSRQLTVCPRCLCWYYLDSGQLFQPPPEKCMAEQAGEPCPNIQHQVYYKRWQESQVSSR